MSKDTLVGISQAAELAQIDKRQIRRWVEQGRLEPAGEGRQRGKPQPLYRLSDVWRLKIERTRAA